MHHFFLCSTSCPALWYVYNEICESYSANYIALYMATWPTYALTVTTQQCRNCLSPWFRGAEE